MNYSNNSELFTPLVGTLPQEEQVHDETQEQSLDDVSSSEEAQDEQSCCDLLMNFMLFALLFLQFGIFFYVHDPAVETLEFSVVAVSIVLFMVAAQLFRTVLIEVGVSMDLALLLPEILVVFTMALAFFQQVVAAFLFLETGKLLMALTVVVINGYRLCKSDSDYELSKQTSAYEALDV